MRTRPANIGALIAALLLAVFAFQLNASMLSPALVVMEKELNATAASIGLTQTAFFTAAALFSLFMPRLGDLVGRRRIMLLMLAGTAIGCAISALAPNVTVLFIGRIAQGIAGPIVPMALVMLRADVPDDRAYAKYMAIVTSVNGGIAGVDALAGGWLASTFGFRAIFWVMTAACVLAVVAISAFTRETTSAHRPPMDWRGVGALVVTIGSLLVALNEAGKLADARWWLVLLLTAVAVVAWLTFWKTEKSVAHPLVTVEHLRSRATWALLATTTLTMTGVFAVMNGLVPAIAQDPTVGTGVSVGLVSWLTLTPYALAGLLMGPISGVLAAKYGYKIVLQCGLLASAVGLLLALWLVSSPTRLLLLIVSIWVGIAYAGMANIMLNGLGVVLSPEGNEGFLPGMNCGAFNLGAGLSFAVLYACQQVVAESQGASAGYQGGIILGLIFVVAALGVSLLIPRPKSAR